MAVQKKTTKSVEGFDGMAETADKINQADSEVTEMLTSGPESPELQEVRSGSGVHEDLLKAIEKKIHDELMQAVNDVLSGKIQAGSYHVEEGVRERAKQAAIEIVSWL